MTKTVSRIRRNVRKTIIMATAALMIFELLFIASSVSAGSTVFGPSRYIRTEGAPNVYTDTFSATPDATAHLTITNGEEDGGHRVTSALVFINDVQIFETNDFKNDIHIMEATLELKDSNTIRVELRSKPGTYLSLEITQESTSLEPEIALSATPDTIEAGSSFELSWNVSHADTITAQVMTSTDTLTETITAEGSSTLSPDETTTYTILAQGEGGSTSKSVTVTVTQVLPEAWITAGQQTIYKGGSTTLSWGSTHTDTCTILPGIGTVDPDGSLEISPEETTTFTLEASGPGGITDKEITVYVTSLPPKASVSIEPEAILPGESATMTWQVSRADSCEIDPGIGQVALIGSMELSPEETTTYTLTATGSGDPVIETVTLYVRNTDLEPLSIDLSGTALDLQTLELTGDIGVTIINNGRLSSEDPFDITLFEDTNGNQIYDAGSDTLIGQRTIPSPPDAGQSMTVSISAKAQMLFRDNPVYVFVDSENRVRETDETNNVTHSMKDCEFKPPVGNFNPVLEWHWSGGETEPENNKVVATPVVANLNDDNNDGRIDNDDIPDIIFNSHSGTNLSRGGLLRAISGDGSTELFTVTDYKTVGGSTPAVGDIDNDGLAEIVTLHQDNTAIAFENDGTLKWISDYYLGASIYDSTVTLGDIDQDGIPEVIVGSVVLNNDGSLKWAGTAGKGKNISCLADLDLDGRPELIAGNTAYTADGDVLWENSAVSDNYTAVANLDDDPNPEIVLMGVAKLYLLEHNGSIKWGPVSTSIIGKGGPPTIADFDNDGQPEIGIAGARYYAVFESDGTLKWKTAVKDASSSITGSSVFDFEGDGNAEVVYADEVNLRILRGTDGKVLFETEVGSRTRVEYPIIVDVDNDNNAEIVVVANDTYFSGPYNGILVFGDANGTWVNTRKIWNQHAYHITNINDDATIPQFAANNWETFNNFRQNQMENACGCTDLSGSMIRLDRSGLPDSVDVIVRVGNGGILHVAPEVTVAFYDGDPDNAGTFLGTAMTTTRILPGKYEDVSFSWSDPAKEMHTLHVRVDDDGTGTGHIYELDEENNLAVSDINLGSLPPVADAGDDRTVIVNEQVLLDGSGSSDPNNAPISYAWRIVSMPKGSTAVLENSSTAKPVFTPDRSGDYTIQLTVNDGELASPVDTIVITAVLAAQVPDVTGKALTSAETAITNAGLALGEVSYQYSSSVDRNLVISQSLSPGSSVPSGSLMDLGVSLGIEMVAVPDLSGLTREEAETALSEASLTMGEVSDEYIDTWAAGLTIRSNPSAGEQVPRDSAVDIAISLGPWTGQDTTPPKVTLSASPNPVDLYDCVTVSVTGSDNSELSTITLTIDGVPVALEGNQAVYTADAAGSVTAQATATDAAGLTTTETLTIKVVNPWDNVPPSISLDEPDYMDVTDLQPITGTIHDVCGFTYTLEYRQKGEETWTLFAKGSGTDISGELGEFDPTLLKNGIYDIRVYAEDFNGNSATAETGAIVDGSLKAGQVIIPARDISLVQPGLPVSVDREYDSRNQDSGDFGPGWSLPSTQTSAAFTGPPGSGWAQTSGGSFMTTYYLVEQYRHVVVIRFSDTDVAKFKMDVSPRSSVLIPLENHMTLKVSYTPLDTTQGTLEAIDVSSSVMLVQNELRQWGTDPYDPARFRYTRRDGTVYIINADSGIESITDPNGNTISFDSSGIHHSSGASVSFERGEGNRIERITDPFSRQIEYFYDENGMLEKIVQTDQGSGAMRIAKRYTYGREIAGNPVLKEIQAPDGTPLGSFEYNAEGRCTALIDALGNRIVYGFDLPGHTQVITDRLGNETLYEYDETGNVTQKTDPLGNTTQWTYDDRGNMLSETDPMGDTATFAYNETNDRISRTDPMGNTITYAYNEKGQQISVTDGRGNTKTTAYDDKGNLLTTTDALGYTTANTYDTDGNLVSSTDVRSNVTTYEYDSSGNRIAQTDPLGNRTDFTYDPYGNLLTETRTRTTESGLETMTWTKEYDLSGNLVRTIDPDGYEIRHEYNGNNRKTAEIDKNGNRIEFDYDASGNIIATRYPDGTETTSAYDAEGNRTAITNRGGQTTEIEYNALKKPVRTVYPNNSETSAEYDPAGRPMLFIDEDGNKTTLSYNSNGIIIQEINPSGNDLSFDYDANGNRTAVIDANGNITHYEYDELNRKIRTLYPDGTAIAIDYDPAGNKTAETDQNGITTLYQYDEMSRLTAVVDALGGETSYIYDEVGNRISQIDPNGNMTDWEYDNLERVVIHTLPLGMSETFTYDPAGNMISKTDFNGDTTLFSYSPCCGRVESKTYPDGSSVSYTYTQAGQVDTITDSRGITDNDYDVMGRLKKITHPDGRTIDYTYDMKGNRTSINTPSGTTTYLFNELGWIVSVDDPGAGGTSYSYDNLGNRTNISNPNGTFTEYTYDNLNRLIRLENKTDTGETISSYDYTLDPAGNRLRIEEGNGRLVTYEYDDLYRLTKEDTVDPDHGNETIRYTYDASGNRLTRTDSSGTTVYSYDENDLLLAETAPGYTHTMSYDNNGNTISKDAGQDLTSYAYDYENRLISVTTGESRIDYDYDPDGIRAAKTVDGSETHYLADKNLPHAQVLEETDGSGSLKARYVYGDRLIYQEGPGRTSYYYFDGLGSTRALADAHGTVTDTYDYEAFGKTLRQTGTTENTHLFAGESLDPDSGLYYLRARYYNPGTGRFMTADPFAGKPAEPMSLHKYLYANMNPVMYVDPGGRSAFSISTVGMTLAIMGVLTNMRARDLNGYNSYQKTLWEGSLNVVTIGGPPGYFSGGTIAAALFSHPPKGMKTYAGACVTVMLGLSFSETPVSGTSGDVTLEIPSIFEGPEYLSGAVSWISATASAGIGKSVTTVSFGNAIGEMNFKGDKVYGVDIGVDFMFGWSHCWNPDL